MIYILASPYCLSEKRYIFDILFCDFLGLDYKVEFEKRTDVKISSGKHCIYISDSFFRNAEKSWLEGNTMPNLPLDAWGCGEPKLVDRLIDKTVPILFGDNRMVFDSKECHLGIDIFGSCFFMLSRYEEVVGKARDEHERFPASASTAFKQGFLQRPIVNEYLEILWYCLKTINPEVTRKKRKYKMQVTADVDQPYAAGIKNIGKQIRQIGGDLLVRKSPIRAISSFINFFATKFGCFAFDPYYKMFDWMMDVNERSANIIDFYFITEHSDDKMDGCYSMDEPIIRKLIRTIAKRGHNIGLHPSYNTYRDKGQLNKEVSILKKVLAEEGIEQVSIGGRQHYLRWDPENTGNNWSQSNLDFDSTLGFADCSGFRCGVCYEYPLYDLVERKKLSIIEKPLIVMEVSYFSDSYMRMDCNESALTDMKKLNDRCKKYDGIFVFLWHNSSFSSGFHQELYKNVVSVD